MDCNGCQWKGVKIACNACQKANDNSSVPNANNKRTIRNEPLGAEKGTGYNQKCSVRVYSKRWRLADPDGISCKAALDGLTKAGVFVDDSAKYIEEVSSRQEKVMTKDEEETIITIEW